MAALIAAAIYALLPTVISLLTMSAVTAMKAIIEKRLFIINENVIDILEDYFGSGSYLGRAGIDVGGIIYGVGFSIIIVSALLSVISSFIKGMQGEASENPFNILIRAIATVFLEIMIFGVSGNRWFGTGLLSQFGNMMSAVIGYITPQADKLMSSVKAFNINIATPADQIVIVVMSFALFKSTISAGIVFVERWLTFAMTLLLGPVFVGMNASRQTADTFKNWIMSVLSQALTIVISFAILIFYVFSMGDLSGFQFFTLGDVLFKYAFTLALLSLYKNSEKLMNAVGIRTVANSDTLRDYGKGLMAMGRLWRETGGMLTMSLGREYGRKAGQEMTHNFSMAMQRKYGENSRIGQMSKSMDLKRSPDVADSGHSARIKDGKYTTDGIPGRSITNQNGVGKNEQSRIAQSAISVNKAMDSGVGTPVKMSDVSRANGLGELSHLKTGSMGYIGSAEKPVLNDKGEIVSAPINGQIFRGTWTNQGKESNPSTYAIFPDQTPLNVGTPVSIGKNSVGDDITYRVGRNDPISLQNGQAYMYELEPDQLMSRAAFEANKEISEKYGNSYSTYLEVNRSGEETYNVRMQADGFDYVWKYTASEKVSNKMFHQENYKETQKRTYSRLEELFKDEEEVRGAIEEERSNIYGQPEDEDDDYDQDMDALMDEESDEEDA